MKDRVEANAAIKGLVRAITVRKVGLGKHIESEAEVKPAMVSNIIKCTESGKTIGMVDQIMIHSYLTIL